MNLVYNQAGIGDVLLVNFDKVSDNFAFERRGDVAQIKDITGNVVGYNIFAASEKMTLTHTGVFLDDEATGKAAEAIIVAAGFEAFPADAYAPNFVVGEVTSCEPHPKSDHLSICQVNIGTKIEQIVCGAANVAAGQKVPVAVVGAIMPSGLQIVPAQLRTVDSNGMICAMRELALPNAPQEKGIMVLPADAPVGMGFFAYYAGTQA
ncbi:MAG: YtpR family tRNA-binding protein [Culicoidibacterales bacterium]